MKKLLFVTLLLMGFVWAGEWFSDPVSGIETAKREQKPVMFYFHSEHCPYCLQMETFVFADEKVSKYLDKFVVLSLSMDSQIGRAWARRFSVFGTPTFVFYDPKKDTVISVVFGSRSKEDFIKLLIMACEKSGMKKC